MKTSPASGGVARWRRLDKSRRLLFGPAILMLATSSVMVALLPFRRVVRFGAIPLGDGPPLDIADCVWAIEAASSRLPLRTMCIEKGLAAQRMLRLSGVDAILHYGARLTPEDVALQAHVWVTVDATTIIGGDVAPGFAQIASFPTGPKGR